MFSPAQRFGFLRNTFHNNERFAYLQFSSTMHGTEQMKRSVISPLALLISYVVIISCAEELTGKTPADLKMPLTLTSRDTASVNSSVVTCPDGSHCQDGHPCCLTSTLFRWYACCDYKYGICCDDLRHCCPRGFRCLPETGCTRAGILQKTKVEKNTVDTGIVICSDGRQGCCPYTNATCCSDHNLCCPSGYRCDQNAKMCVLGNVRVPMLRITKCPRGGKSPTVNSSEKIRYRPQHVQNGELEADDLPQ